MPITNLLFIIFCIGHACLWTYILNVLYSQPLPKRFLRLWRILTGIIIVAGIPCSIFLQSYLSFDPLEVHILLNAMLSYTILCWILGGISFPLVTLSRLLRSHPACVINESSRILKLWPEHGDALVGDGKWHRFARLPLNDIFTVEFTDYTIRHPRLPAAWDGLTILHLTDFHFHGTPSQLYFQRIIDEIHNSPTPDLVVLTGDYLDSDVHAAWIKEILGQLKWNDHGLAILGNHDVPHHPDRIRIELSQIGITVLSNRWQEIIIRGERCVVVGNELPWLGPLPELTNAPKDCFRLCLSHSPDQFEYWAADNNVDLLFCGHVHGGQIRLPLIGSIFVPSKFSRKYDQGVFQQDVTVMVVSRGLSGKEPLRFRCPAQVVRVTLRNP